MVIIKNTENIVYFNTYNTKQYGYNKMVIVKIVIRKMVIIKNKKKYSKYCFILILIIQNYMVIIKWL